MNLIFVKNYEEMSEKAYEIVKKILIGKKNATLGLATGTTPLGLYNKMIEDFNLGNVSYKNVTTYNLDEYVGLSTNDEQSYTYFMRTNLFNHIDIDLKNTHLLDGMAKNMNEACDNYNKMLEKADIDVQILGIGGNGHIAFNEPNEPFDSVTHIIDLTPKTISDNARFFTSINDVPTRAISMGIANIMATKSIILLASGANKADAVYAAVKGDISKNCPASALRNHKNVTFIVDDAAAAKIK